jgi:hypothetical protein
MARGTLKDAVNQELVRVSSRSSLKPVSAQRQASAACLDPNSGIGVHHADSSHAVCPELAPL